MRLLHWEDSKNTFSELNWNGPCYSLRNLSEYKRNFYYNKKEIVNWAKGAEVSEIFSSITN